MEIIPLAGYTEDEKREIARRHLIDKAVKNHGLKKGEFELTDSALTSMIQHYTREAGVRNLEREVAKVARKAVTKIVKGEVDTVTVTAENWMIFWRAQIPLWSGGKRGSGGRCHRAGLYICGR